METKQKHNFIGYSGEPVGTDKDPVEYRGFLIYERILVERTTSPHYIPRTSKTYYRESVITGTIWAVVKDGREISQLAGPNGAKRAIDVHLSGENTFNKLMAAK